MRHANRGTSVGGGERRGETSVRRFGSDPRVTDGGHDVSLLDKNEPQSIGLVCRP